MNMGEAPPPSFALSPAQQALFDEAYNSGYNRWAGVKLLEHRQGFARLSFFPRAEMLTPWGTLNGGVINSLLEVPAFFALLPQLSGGELPVTNDIFVQHVRPLPGDMPYELTGQLSRRGRSMAWLEATAWVGGNPCTYARLTKTIILK